MEKICLICEGKFDGRADAKTCSDKCKKALQRIKGTDLMELSGTIVKGDSPELAERGQKISEAKRDELKGTNLPAVSPDDPCNTGTDNTVILDLVKDLKLDLHKDLGVTAWTKNGIFIRDDITIDQVRNIRRIVEAKHGWPHRTYSDGPSIPYTTARLGA